jgi:hypothetical protein
MASGQLPVRLHRLNRAQIAVKDERRCENQQPNLDEQQDYPADKESGSANEEEPWQGAVLHGDNKAHYTRRVNEERDYLRRKSDADESAPVPEAGEE